MAAGDPVLKSLRLESPIFIFESLQHKALSELSLNKALSELSFAP